MVIAMALKNRVGDRSCSNREEDSKDEGKDDRSDDVTADCKLMGGWEVWRLGAKTDGHIWSSLPLFLSSKLETFALHFLPALTEYLFHKN